MAFNSIINSCFSEQRWVDRINNIFQKEVTLHPDKYPSACVFLVPYALRAEKPEAYAPHLIALGPCHHLNAELYQMERYKLLALREFLSSDQIINFKQILIDKLVQLELVVRACYQRYMEFDDETLAWIVAIDGLFLLNLLHSHFDKDDTVDGRLTQGTILTRDIMMLENQVPFILLKEIRRSVNISLPDDEEDEELFNMLLDFCEEHSPLKLSTDFKDLLDVSHVHLLDLMYHLIVQNQESRQAQAASTEIDLELILSGREDASDSTESPVEGKVQEHIVDSLDRILDVADDLGIKGAEKVKTPVKVLRIMPWAKISGLFKASNDTDTNKNRVTKEMTMPSASKLYRFGNIRCSLTPGGIKDIKFVEKELKLYLPQLTLNASSEVILRNLVAYEVAISWSNHELGQYVNLMSGILKAAADVKLLRKSCIITGVLSDDEVAYLFNGMKNPFMKSDQKSNLEITIANVNRIYDKGLIVKTYKCMKKNVYSSWRFLTLLSAILLLLMLSLQSFCDVYSCRRWSLSIH